MSNDALAIFPERRPIEFFEEVISVRGCRLSLADITEAYMEMHRINQEFGRRLIAELPQNPEMTDEQWSHHKEALLRDAFRLTVSITGQRDQHVYAEDAEVFSSENLPKPIKRIYFTNVTAFSRHAEGASPRNKISVLFDFSKPELLDPNPLVSDATPNESHITVNADDVSFFRAIQRVVDTKVKSKRTMYGFLHKNFAYDLGLWVFALPLALFFSTYYTDQLIPTDGRLASYRWAVFIYLAGMFLIGYRGLSSYAKWAFPVNVLEENKDKALTHRLALGGVAGWLFYKALAVVENMVFG